MQFIDINAMLGEWTPKNLFLRTADEMEQEMKRVGIEKAYVMDTKAWLSELAVGNNAAVQAAKEHSMLSPVMVMTPLLEQEFGGREGAVEFICKNRIGAVRLFPRDHGYTLTPWNIDKLFTLLSDLRMPVLIDEMEHTGGLESYDELYHLCCEYPDVPIVLLTPGYRSARMIYPMMEKCKNFHIDTSLLIAYRTVEEIVACFGAEHILFGTRMPYLEPGTFVGRILYADISQEDKEKIAFGNIDSLNRQIRYPY